MYLKRKSSSKKLAKYIGPEGNRVQRAEELRGNTNRPVEEGEICSQSSAWEGEGRRLATGSPLERQGRGPVGWCTFLSEKAHSLGVSNS